MFGLMTFAVASILMGVFGYRTVSFASSVEIRLRRCAAIDKLWRQVESRYYYQPIVIKVLSDFDPFWHGCPSAKCWYTMEWNWAQRTIIKRDPKIVLSISTTRGPAAHIIVLYELCNHAMVNEYTRLDLAVFYGHMNVDEYITECNSIAQKVFEMMLNLCSQAGFDTSEIRALTQDEMTEHAIGDKLHFASCRALQRAVKQSPRWMN